MGKQQENATVFSPPSLPLPYFHTPPLNGSARHTPDNDLSICQNRPALTEIKAKSGFHHWEETKLTGFFDLQEVWRGSRCQSDRRGPNGDQSSQGPLVDPG